MAIDIEQPDALLAYLRGSRRIGVHEQPATHVLSGGASSRTVLVERPSGEAWVMKQALRRLRVGIDWYSGPERIHREAEGMIWLERLSPPGTITPLVFEDRAQHILAMRAVPQPHQQWKNLLLGGQADMAYAEQFGAILGTIQRVSYQRRDELAPLFNDRSFFEALRIEPYYVYTWTRLPETGTFYDGLIGEMRTRRQVLTHGDYSPKNILIHAGRLTLIDHETIHFGDPAFDPGFGVAHLLSKAHHLPERRAALLELIDCFWQAYRASLGNVPWLNGLEARAARHALGCLLARVAGRSTLAYLSRQECEAQQAAALALIRQPPATIKQLAEQFLSQLEGGA